MNSRPVGSTHTWTLTLWTWNVDQFHSALALRTLLTPADIVMRKAAYSLAFLHSRAGATCQQVRLSDLDSLVVRVCTLMVFRYIYEFMQFWGMLVAIMKQ
jgi:hypothetical protein